MDQRVDAGDTGGMPPASGLTPVTSPMAMPDQPLWRARKRRPCGSGVLLARLALVLLSLGGTAVFAWTLYQVLSVEPPTPLQLVFLVACTLCFFWISIGSASACIGFALLVFARTGMRHVEDRNRVEPPVGRLALLFPVYRENPTLVAASIEAMAGDLTATGAGDFDIFILSDTQDPAERAREADVYMMLRRNLAGAARIYARWRTPNRGKKAGNIRDWVEQHGGAYAYFIILDADSVMSAAAVKALVAEMEKDPEVGLVQTVPRLTGARSTFARLQQFASAYYGHLLATGIAAWHGDDGNYWGHNAIVRTRAFASAAGLPELPGKPPLGGHILSHDFVEAALLRRAGWSVRLLPHLEGSYEGCPPSLPDLVVRDRRWAQGNLQHLRLLRTHGLTMTSRAHLAMGAWAYLASPVWALTLVVGMLLALAGQYRTPAYFGTEISLFPKWPVFDAEKALALFVAVLFTVQLPKILGVVWAAHRGLHPGGAVRLVAGAVFETVMSTLVAPILMVTQSGAVFAVAAGRDAGWNAQRRTGGPDTAAAFLILHRAHIAWGSIAAVVAALVSWPAFAWMSPVIAGLLLSGYVAAHTARDAPAFLRSILAVPEDGGRRPSVLDAVEAAHARWLQARAPAT